MQLPWPFLLVVFYFGCLIGSFLNVLILRLPKDQTLLGRSHCMSCRHTLSAWELMPLFSFLLLRGRCSNCSKRISWRYFGIEFLTGALFVLVWKYVEPAAAAGFLQVLEYFVFAAVCVVIFFIDLEHFLILDKVVYPSAILVLVLKILTAWLSGLGILPVLGYSVLGAVVGAVPFLLIWYFSGGKWMGFGDVKLMLLLGVAAGWPLVLVTLFGSIMLGGVSGVFLLAFGHKSLKSKVPFGTFLTVGALVCLFFGQSLLTWYLSLLGI